MTADIQKFVIKKLHSTRKVDVCTSKTLQDLLAQEKAIAVNNSTIRKFLLSKGYRWLPRAQKREYSGPEMEVREQFVKRVLRMSRSELRRELGLSIDGVVIAMPPVGDVARWNHCMSAETHMWRKLGEAASPELCGGRPVSNTSSDRESRAKVGWHI